ncbi:uncharacterized protein LOC114761802 [Neltuma alba]|uniref:uncharacterized protein LOC114761802 n=1 Tax=Neltuma alba TaxID=207710 RepID=UPI0010A2E071|nr:uncharacterized protein LOC114761802 [Prosopis alba]XP_028807070.1 uncharacterized protein LOC114761802 [Prosopis alba]
MAGVGSPAHFSNKLFNSSTSLLPPVSQNFTSKPKQALRVRCALSPTKWREGRRPVSISLALSHLLFIPNQAASGSILDRYVKKKRLDPLEVYVPPIILTQLQIKDLEKTLDGAEPQFAACRSLLRAGPAASLRVNIRAVAQYASDSGNGKTAFSDVDQCLSALEELDSLLLRASRNEPEATVKSMKAKISATLNALDSLLQTVPSDVLNKGEVIADSYRNMEDEDTASLDPELKQLEEIL